MQLQEIHYDKSYTFVDTFSTSYEISGNLSLGLKGGWGFNFDISYEGNVIGSYRYFVVDNGVINVSYTFNSPDYVEFLQYAQDLQEQFKQLNIQYVTNNS